MCKIKKINTLNLKIFTYEIFKKMLSVNYEIITTFYRMTRTPQMLHCERYGLCASVWSQNVGTIHRVAQQLEVGTVWSNCWLIRF